MLQFNSHNRFIIYYTHSNVLKQIFEAEKDAEVIVQAIESVPNLETLDINGISLGIEGAEALANAIAKRKTLKNCDWGNCFKSRLLEEIPPALIHLAEGLKKSGARIRRLDLSDNAFGPNGARGVKPILETEACLELEEIHLENCGLGVGGGEIVGSGLEVMNDNIRKAGLTPKLRFFFIFGQATPSVDLANYSKC